MILTTEPPCIKEAANNSLVGTLRRTAQALGVNMAHLARSKAILRIFGDELVPEDITRLLAHEPSNAYTKGHVEVLRSGQELTRKTGAWFLEATPTEPEDLNGQVAEILSKLNTDMASWEWIRQQFEVDLFCGWFMNRSNEGVSISAHTLKALGERGIELSLDIYGSDEDESAE